MPSAIVDLSLDYNGSCFYLCRGNVWKNFHITFTPALGIQPFKITCKENLDLECLNHQVPLNQVILEVLLVRHNQLLGIDLLVLPIDLLSVWLENLHLMQQVQLRLVLLYSTIWGFKYYRCWRFKYTFIWFCKTLLLVNPLQHLVQHLPQHLRSCNTFILNSIPVVVYYAWWWIDTCKSLFISFFVCNVDISTLYVLELDNLGCEC